MLKGFTQSEFEDALNKASGMPSSTPDQVGAPAGPAMTSSPSQAPAVPVDMPLPATPAMPSSTVNSQPLSNDSVDMPKLADLDMPSNDTTPGVAVTSVAPAVAATDDPQDELNSLLEDLQTKVDTIEPMSEPTPAISVTPSQAAPVSYTHLLST